jgi:hypothetical protein
LGRFCSDIGEYFKDRYSHEESLLDVQTSDTDKMSLSEVMGLWDTKLEDAEDAIPPDPQIRDFNEANVNDLMSQDSNEEAEEEEKEEAIMPELLTYRDFISKTPAYEWLLASLHRESLMAPAEPNSMGTIRRKIIYSLPSSHKISRKKSAETYKVTFRVEWDPMTFIREQEYSVEPDEAVEIAITLTGSTKDAQALTCAQYLCQTWPSAGEHTIRLVKNVVRSGPGHQHTCRFSGLKWP